MGCCGARWGSPVPVRCHGTCGSARWVVLVAVQVEQPTLFPVVEKGSHVKVLSESGEFQGAGEVVAMIWKGFRAKTIAVRLYTGGVVIRPAERVVLNDDVVVL